MGESGIRPVEEYVHCASRFMPPAAVFPMVDMVCDRIAHDSEEQIMQSATASHAYPFSRAPKTETHQKWQLSQPSKDHNARDTPHTT